MNTRSIMNIGILAHVDAGKTTLTEQMLYRSGELRKRGNVDDGTAQTDWLSIERARGISVRSSSVTLTHRDRRINVIDTPGHADFGGEVERSLMVLDCAILMVSAADGMESRTELLLEALGQTKTPTLVLINKIDRGGSDAAGVMDDIAARVSSTLLPFQAVSGQGGRHCAVIPRDLSDTGFMEQTIAALSEWDPAVLDAYVSGNPPSPAVLSDKLRAAIGQARILPVLYASASLGVGVGELMDFLVGYMPACEDTRDAPLSAVVYKIEHDPSMGKIAHVRMFAGMLRNRDSVEIPSSGQIHKITQIRRIFGAKQTDIGEVHGGDIAALYGLPSARIGDVIGEKGPRNGYSLAVPLLLVQVLPRDESRIPELLAALGELCDEDPLLELEYLSEEKEIRIRITGTIQLEILSAFLKERYGLEAGFSAPSVIYRETPARAAEGFAAYTMPKPCWAVVRLHMEPGAPGSGLAFLSTVHNDDMYLRYQHHVETSVRETLRQGLYGWEVTDLRVTLTGGEHHIVHTHPMDFFVATPMAVMDGLEKTGTILLEPMVTLRIAAPEEALGRVIGDMIGMRGEYDAPVLRAGEFILEARVPVSTSLAYPIRLAVLTSGRGRVSTRFAGYQPCPPELGAVAGRRGVDPRDRSRWILSKRSALRT